MKIGDTISFAGTVSAPDGATLNAVQVSVLLAANPKEGAMYKRLEGIGESAFELSTIPTMTVGDSYNGFAMEAGKSYIVMLYAQDSNGSGFVDQNQNPELYEGPSILVHVKESTSVETPVTDYIYTINNGEVTITGYTGSDVNVIVPSTIEDCPVKMIGKDAFRGCSSLSSVTIPDSVTSIGDYSFYGCESLSSITIPDGVTSIGWSAFYGCKSLSSVTIPDGVTSIDGYSFYGCESLSSITIPDGVTSIGWGAFYGCKSLSSVIIPDGVTSIGGSAFYECSSLSSITIPDGVLRFMETGIESDHFWGFRPFTPEELYQILSELYNRAADSPYTHLFFLKPGIHLIPDEIGWYEDRGICFLLPQTHYDIENGHSELLFQDPSFCRFFSGYFRKWICQHYAYSEADSLIMLRNLLDQFSKTVTPPPPIIFLHDHGILFFLLRFSIQRTHHQKDVRVRIVPVHIMNGNIGAHAVCNKLLL